MRAPRQGSNGILLLFAAAAGAAFAAAASGATITVNSTLDVSANDGKCTLHEAIIAANTDAASGGAAGECAAGSGTDQIHFAIPASDSGCNGSGVCTILTGGLPSLDTALTIDGFTQSGASVNTLPFASNAVLKIVVTSAIGGGSGSGLFVNNTGITIRGIVINGGFSKGIASLSGPFDVGAKVVGCYIGTDVTGMNPLFNTWGINVSGVDWQIGGTAAADRNIVAADGYAMILGNVTNPKIQGNLIGIKANGTSAFSAPVGTVGVTIFQVTGGALFGGSTAGAGNVLGGFGTGLYVQSTLSGTITVQGNRIGTDGAGTIPLGNRGSAFLADAAQMTIGGPGTGEGNIIAFSGKGGVVIGPYSHDLVGVKVRGNSIHDNSQSPAFSSSDLGIDIGVSSSSGTIFGATDNDPLDADGGSNGQQNFPLVNTVTASNIQGTLNSEANKTYTLDFYANTNCSVSGYGEGETYLGSTQVTTNGSGNASFNYGVSVPAGKKVTATATAPDGSTSEFSRCADLLARFLDADPLSGATSDGNGVFEPGETATVRPNWENPTELSLPATSTASALTGPAGASYSTVDAASDYGSDLQEDDRQLRDHLELFHDVRFGSRRRVRRALGRQLRRDHVHPRGRQDLEAASRRQLRGRAPVAALLQEDRGGLPFRRHRRVRRLALSARTLPWPRDQMAIFLARAIAHGGANVPASGSVGGQPYNCVAGGVSLYTDVAPTSIACKSIHYIAAQNVTTGCNPGLYCPTQLVTRAQMAIFVAKGVVAPAGGPGVPLTYTDPAPPHLSYSCDAAGTPHSYFTDVTPADSFCKHVNYLYLKNVIAGCSGSQYCPDANVTRGEMAKFLGNAFNLLLYGP